MRVGPRPHACFDAGQGYGVLTELATFVDCTLAKRDFYTAAYPDTRGVGMPMHCTISGMEINRPG